MAGEKGKPGPPRILVRRHILSIDKKDKAFFEDLLPEEITKLIDRRGAWDSVKAVLGNPVAVPILVGGISILAGVLILRAAFPSFAEAVPSQVRDKAEDVARFFWEITHGIGGQEVPGTGGETVEDVFKTFTENFADLIRRIWEGIVRLPPVL